MQGFEHIDGQMNGLSKLRTFKMNENVLKLIYSATLNLEINNALLSTQ
jgi:hypothetical protein